MIERYWNEYVFVDNAWNRTTVHCDPEDAGDAAVFAEIFND